MILAHLSNDELLASLATVIGSYNELTARLVAHLGEIEERRLHAIAGYSSMYEFCVKELRLSESASLRRITAARAARKFPILFDMLEAGAIHLSAIELLHKRLTPENHVELLEACAGKSKAEVEHVLASWFPAPDVPATIQKIPEAPELGLERRVRPHELSGVALAPVARIDASEAFVPPELGSVTGGVRASHTRAARSSNQNETLLWRILALLAAWR